MTKKTFIKDGYLKFLDKDSKLITALLEDGWKEQKLKITKKNKKILTELKNSDTL